MAWLRKRGSIFHVGWRENDADRYESLKTGDPEAAETGRLQKELSLRLTNGAVLEPTPGFLLKQLMDIYGKQVDISPATLRLNYYSWNKFMALTGIQTIEDTLQEGLVKKFKDKASAAKVSNMYISLCLRDMRKLCKFAVGRGLIAVNPFEGVKLPEQEKVARILTPEEESRLLAASKPLLRRIIQLELKLGLRLMQLATLDWKQVDLKACTLHIPSQKRQKARSIPLLPDTVSILGEPKEQGRIFTELEGKDNKTIHDAIEGLFTRVKRKAGIKGKLRFHDLRHTCASRLAHILNPFELRDFFGWSSVALTDRYTHTSTESIRKKLTQGDSASPSL